MKKLMSSSTLKQDCISPIDGCVYVSRELASPSQVLTRLKKAEQAQPLWQSTAIEQRKRICENAINLLLEKQHEISLELSWMMGRPIQYGAGELEGVAERANYMISLCEQALSKIKIPEKTGFTRFITREPVGNVLVIAPWNYPYLTAINAIIPALLSGNCVLLKHSAQTPLCAERLYQAFQEAGLPAGVFQYLHISHEQTTKLIKAPEIDFVAFTGSVKGGEMVEKAAVGRFIGVGLELGGKDPAYIRHDADIDNSVATVIDGAFFNSGQSCCGIERIYVHASVYDQFVGKAVALCKHYILGRADDPKTTLGPMVRIAAADFVRKQINEAIQQGAVAHIDENLFPKSVAGSAYLAPQILTNVNHNMRVMSEESFGPVVGIMKVENDQQAIALMNDSDFGLTASIFTLDIDTGIKLGQQITTGTLFINRCDYLDPALAWTGVKQSGRGCSLSRLGFDQLTRPKSFNIKHT
jgi:acyl-CoA reductase-like NAD-dependent aldehyde dehydrogenase